MTSVIRIVSAQTGLSEFVKTAYGYLTIPHYHGEYNIRKEVRK
jgi:hypothetical protein